MYEDYFTLVLQILLPTKQTAIDQLTDNKQQNQRNDE